MTASSPGRAIRERGRARGSSTAATVPPRRPGRSPPDPARTRGRARPVSCLRILGDRLSLAGESSYCSDLRVTGGNVPGGFAERVAVPAANVARIPLDMDFADAAAMPTAWATAWHAVSVADVKPGECVALQAGASTVSLAVIQILRAREATVIAAASTDEKLAVARSLGATLGIRNESYGAEVVRDFIRGKGADVVIDHVGAATWSASLATLRIGGRLVLLGNTSGDRVDVSLAQVFHRGLRLIGSGGYTAVDFAAGISFALERGRKLPLAGTYAADDLPAAWSAVESRGTISKVIIRHV